MKIAITVEIKKGVMQGGRNMAGYKLLL